VTRSVPTPRPVGLRYDPRRASSTELRRRLVDHPALAEVLPQLSPGALIRLYETVGLHDAGSLMTLTPPRLLARALGEAVWTEQRSRTRLDADVFIDWLAVWLDEGERFAARQLLALGDDLLTVCLGAVLEVTDSSVDGFHRWNQDDGDGDAPGEAQPLPADMTFGIDRFLVAPQQEDERELLETALQALWNEAPDFLLRLLERLTADDSRLDGEGLRYRAHDDAAAARDTKREQAGYVSRPAAEAFLGQVRVLDMEGIVALTGYDLESARHLGQLGAAGQPPGRPRSRGADTGAPQPEEAPSGDAVVGNHSTEPPFDRQAAPPGAEVWALLAAAGVIESAAPTALLDGPGNEPLTLERRLDALAARHPAALGQVARELAYLANVLLTLELPGAGSREDLARQLAFATTNLGLELLEARGRPVDLHRPPGAVRAFLLGWATLLDLPARLVAACASALESPEARRRLASRMWLHDTVRESIADLAGAVPQQRFDVAREALTLLSLALDAHACRAAVHLLGVPPQFPALLEGGDKDASRWIRTRQDLEQLAGLLRRLPPR
jgi:hypothetical protein